MADLGERALRGTRLSDVLDDAVTQVVRVLNVDYCKVLELLPSRQALLRRHGGGWQPGYVGPATVGLGTESQAGSTLLADAPVVVEDWRTEQRFAGTGLLHAHDVVRGISVIISTQAGPYGVLGVHTHHRRTFSRDEINFLQAVANILGSATKSQSLAALSHLLALSRPGTWPEPEDIVTLAHAEMVQQLIALENFVTLCYARLDLNQQKLDLVDCGHTGVVHFHTQTSFCTMVHGNNLPLGIRAGEMYDQLSVAFEPGDMLLFYSDGVTEARNAVGELFGVERLEDCVRRHGALDPEVLVEAIRRAACAFAEADQLSDDLTCVAIKVEARQLPLTRAELELRSDITELRQARAFVRAVCSALPGTPLAADRVAELELAVNEATSNIMKHAYHGRTDQRIHLEAETFPDHMIIRLHHIGDPCDPARVPPPALDGSQESGFGVYLIHQSVDDVHYSCDARGRNCITLVKRRRA